MSAPPRTRPVIAHLVHPVAVPPESDLREAQPITFETMRRAQQFAQGVADVRLLAIQYADEPRIPLPDAFVRLPDLTRSVADVAAFRERRRLALIRDLLDALHAAGHADFLVYTNVDIALQPPFYAALDALIARGRRAFVINRRTIPKRGARIEDIPRMCAEIGDKHPGWDCFVFPRESYPSFLLGDACIGTDWIGRILVSNLACFVPDFAVFGDLHLTFHLGDDRPWTSDRFADYADHNRRECERILGDLARRFGPFDPKGFPGRFFRHLENTRPEGAR